MSRRELCRLLRQTNFSHFAPSSWSLCTTPNLTLCSNIYYIHFRQWTILITFAVYFISGCVTDKSALRVVPKMSDVLIKPNHGDVRDGRQEWTDILTNFPVDWFCKWPRQTFLSRTRVYRTAEFPFLWDSIVMIRVIDEDEKPPWLKPATSADTEWEAQMSYWRNRIASCVLHIMQ
jgi:hypothetical protein